MVVVAQELIVGNLLELEVGPRVSGNVLLESSVHVLVAAVLLRLARSYAFREYAQSDPPGRESGYPAGGDACKGGAVIRANDPGQAIFTKGGNPDWFSELGAGIGQRLASQQHP